MRAFRLRRRAPEVTQPGEETFQELKRGSREQTFCEHQASDRANKEKKRRHKGVPRIKVRLEKKRVHVVNVDISRAVRGFRQPQLCGRTMVTAWLMGCSPSHQWLWQLERWGAYTFMTLSSAFASSRSSVSKPSGNRPGRSARAVLVCPVAPRTLRDHNRADAPLLLRKQN